MSAPATAQPLTLGEWLWPRMQDLYGSAWTRDHGDHDERGTWSSALAKFHPTQIKGALANCLQHYPNKAPTLGQFRNLVKQVPNPDAPLQLEPPKVDQHENCQQWLKDLKAMMEKAEQAGPMTEEQRQYHLKALGLDDETLAKKTAPWIEPGSPHACAYPGCSRPGALAHNGGGHWYCSKHFKRD